MHSSLPLFPRVFGALLALLAGSALAQPAAQRPLSPDRVTFFTEPNFKGESLVVEAGAGVENLDTMQRHGGRPWTFAISSVRVEGTAKATVFSGAGFRGDRLEITRDIADLYGERRGDKVGTTWDRSIASVSVAGPQRVIVQAPPPARPPTTVVVVPAAPVRPPPETVVVIQEPPRPEPPPRPRFSRREAEEIVRRAYREVLDRNADPSGIDLYRDRLMHQGWTEHQVVQALQRSPEARGIKAEESITKIYREVLGRDPDPNGLAHYRAKWRDGWTQGDIRDDLRRSKEGRDHYIRTAITRQYRELLGREPDPQGYANFERLMREKGFTEEQLRRAILSSDEYRQRKRR